MDEEVKKHWLKKVIKSKTTYIIVALLITNALFYLKYKTAEYDLRYSQTVPRVELSNTLNLSLGSASGKLVGFVAFKNTNNQPKDFKQYLVIEAHNKVYTAQDIYAFNNLAPRYAEPYLLAIVEDNASQLTLKDDSGNIFLIDKSSSEVSWVDPQGDRSDLITSDIKYRDFILSLYK